jgi:glutamate-1-semialdehyde 2,1-aminomutase
MSSRLHYNGLGSQTGVVPDLTTLGKWIGGGMTFGAFGGRRDIMALYDPRSAKLEHPGTFNNNVFTMSAGLAGCSLLTADTINALNSRGDAMRQRIEHLLSERNILAAATVPATPVLDEQHSAAHPRRPPKMFIKGVGSLMAVHFAGPDRELLQGLFYHHMLQHKIYMAQRGFVALNIMLTEADVASFVAATEGFLNTWKHVLQW